MFDEIKKKYLEMFESEKLPYIRCNKCGYVFFYPRDYCPKCGSKDLAVLESKGVGKVFSYTKFVNKDGKEVIYGIVELHEGFRMYTNFLEEVDIGDEVAVKYIIKDGRKIPVFSKNDLKKE